MVDANKIETIIEKFPRAIFIGDTKTQFNACYTGIFKEKKEAIASIYGEEHPHSPNTIRIYSEAKEITKLPEKRQALFERLLEGLVNEPKWDQAQKYELRLSPGEWIKKYIVDPLVDKYRHRNHSELNLINPEF